jgi:hypothetical protein
VAVVLDVHLLLGLAFLVLSFGLAGWAYALHRRRAALPEAFWRLQRGGAHLLALQVVVGLVLRFGFRLRPPTALHFLYAALAVLSVAAQMGLDPRRSLGRMLREEGRLREAGACALLALLAGLFALRLYMTGVGLP